MNIDQNTIIEATVEYFLRYWTGKPGLTDLRRYIHSEITRAQNDGKLTWQTSNRWETYKMSVEAGRRLKQRKATHASYRRLDPDRTATSIEDEIQKRAQCKSL